MLAGLKVKDMVREWEQCNAELLPFPKIQVRVGDTLCMQIGWGESEHLKLWMFVHPGHFKPINTDSVKPINLTVWDSIFISH